MKPAVFLDRDGVLNIDKGYVYKIEDFEWTLGAKQAIKFFNNLDFYVFVITNQSGISRGYYTEKDVEKLHDYLKRQLERESIIIHDFFYSPFHPLSKIKKYKKFEHLRKPNTGMLELACEKWKINLNKSILIGDKNSDIECARNFNIPGYLFNEKNLFDFVNKKIKLF